MSAPGLGLTWPAAGCAAAAPCVSGPPPVGPCTAGRTAAGRTAELWPAPAALSGTGSRGCAASLAPRRPSAPNQNAVWTPTRCDPTSSETSCLEGLTEREDSRGYCKSFVPRKSWFLKRVGRINGWMTCLTIQQVSGAEVYVDAGVEAWDEPVEGPLLHTLTWERHNQRELTGRRAQTPHCVDRPQVRAILPSSQL